MMQGKRKSQEIDEVDIKGNESLIRDFCIRYDRETRRKTTIPIPECLIIFEEDIGEGYGKYNATIAAKVKRDHSFVELSLYSRYDICLLTADVDLASLHVDILFIHDILAKKHPEDGIRTVEAFAQLYYDTMFFLSNFIDDETVVEKSYQQITRIRGSHKRKQKKKNVVYVRKTRLKIIGAPPEPKNRTFERHIDSWTVRGHWRTLQNGNQTWVKPHVKGSGDVSKKTYKVGD